MTNLPKSPIKVAERILWLRRDSETTPMHLLKLVYLCHGWMLGNTGRRLVSEPAEAWRYGPVIPSIYHRFKSFKGDPIDIATQDSVDQFSAYQIDLIRIVTEAYRQHTALSLSAITHQPGSPWDQVYNEGRGEGAIIPDRIIQRYYEERVKQAA